MRLLENDGILHLSDEYKNDARLNIRVSPDQLYAFQIANSHFDAIIKTFLRSYGGLFENYVNVQEKELLNRSGLTETEFYRQLKLLQDYQIIDFVKGSKLPILTFLEERLPNTDLKLNKIYWKARREVLMAKVLGMCNYVEKNECRSKQILAYFAELNYDICGQCDVCLAAKNTDNEENIKEKIFERIINESSKENLSLQQILLSFTDFPENLLKATVQELIDEGRIQFNGKNGVIEKKPKH
jgi:ATP-dependent DNA helicase RecQ